jgi:polysaccharide deacetylase 2 family uncharacterized protein YibQ
MDSIRSYNPSFYFLDSRTSPRSVAYTQARDAGLSTISRDIFLDNDPSTTAIELQYNIWLTRARERGSAIAIGHPYSHTLKVLQHSLPEAGENFTFMRISELIEARSKNESSTQWGSQLTTPETAAE